MALKDLTLPNIAAFIEGNFKAHIVGFKNLPLLEQEQIFFRMKVCSSCLSEGQCPKCFCDLPERFFIDKEDHKCTFPKFKDLLAWNEFKKTKQYIDAI